jgi:hypothetical protein
MCFSRIRALAATRASAEEVVSRGLCCRDPGHHDDDASLCSSDRRSSSWTVVTAVHINHEIEGKNQKRRWSRKVYHCRMALQFHHALEGMEIWSAASDGFSFVISHENRTGPGLHGSPGFTASWRPLYQNKAATRIVGSPFKTFAEAEAACNTQLEHLRDR